MTCPDAVELIASCWTSAGNAAPLEVPETSPVPIGERLDALADTGWAGFGLAHDDLVAARNTIGFPELRRLIDRAGFGYVEVELLSNWWDETLAHEWRPQFELLLEAAETLGARFIKVGTAIGDESGNYEQFVDPLKRLTLEASSRGARIALEPMAFSNVRSIPLAADLMRKVDMPDCGLVVDYWHVFRHGTPLEDLSRTLTADQIFAVELNDADQAVHGTLFEDTRDHRRLCGQGDQDVTGFIRTLRDIGFEGPWAVEILSNEHRALPLREALESAYATALSCFPA
ncbi:sugar phosphate isomerase/epimerase [Arthrobacter silviterrae]|uniref:Sugar phosphate isomerase/epimerase n=1 Tax=Arthrobacter silviterrae TaxID=2026658 RepID=A0ABX0DHF0_9MICC|nr:sugar phosphate isomerase/epimerase family protein [Arthrobacter silviterrae]MDQ0276510.1 sugar phosphate isomerase/epimerase [Arthrobacter silviterrae]NGN85176.1 sugar phosphate isomerase/epimerase [Arthrobacter silviterrae]